MSKSRFTEAQIWDDQGAGGRASDGGGLPQAWLSTANFYKLKAKYGGMSVSDAHRLRQLEDENGKLKRLLANSMLDNAILKDLLEKG